MGSHWFKNLAGLTLTEEELKDLPHPRSELFFHVTLRGMQLTSILGAVLVAPLVTVAKHPRSLNALGSRCLQYAAYGLIPGMVVGPMMYWGKMKNQPEDGYLDRCYRLRCNKGQVRVDRLSLTGAVAGGIAGAFTTFRPVESAVLGMLGGIVLAATYTNVIDA